METAEVDHFEAHSMESNPKLKQINFQILPLKPVFIILALLIWYVVKQIWEYLQ